MPREYFSCLTLVVLVLTLGSESMCQQQYSIATSSIGGSSGVASSASFSSSYSVGIPAAGEVSSNTFWTSGGVGPIASLLACPVWWICGVTFYDANLNGIQDAGECGIPGRLITIIGPSDTISITTDANGAYCRTCLSPGRYTLCQALPDSTATCKWITTTLCKTKDVTQPWKANIGSAYSCIDGARSIGYWSNKHSSELIADADLSALRTLNLRNTNGSNFDPTTASEYQSWLTSANASNIAYQLSEHLSALKLNIAHGLTPLTADVDSGRNLATMMDHANCLLSNPIGTCGGGFVGQNGSATTAPSPLRTEQERVKNIIKKINSHGSFVQPASCAPAATAAVGGSDQRYISEANENNVINSPSPKPTAYALLSNYPNPFNPSTKIRYNLPENTWVTLKVYNTLGQEVVTLVDGVQEAGYKLVEFNASNLPSAVYFYSMHAGNFSEVQKMLLLK